MRTSFPLYIAVYRRIGAQIEISLWRPVRPNRDVG